MSDRWVAFDPIRNWPDLGPRFAKAEATGRAAVTPRTTPDSTSPNGGNFTSTSTPPRDEPAGERVEDDTRDLSWATVLKRTFEGYIRGERPNMYGEWIRW